MQTRFCATIRRPACSIMAFTAPVRLRAVASGLMIEKVRSIAIVFVLLGLPSGAHEEACAEWRAYSRRAAVQQVCGTRSTIGLGGRHAAMHAEFTSKSKAERQFTCLLLNRRHE